MRYFGHFRAKMTTISIKNPKLIVTNDYQQFWVHFECFLALFHISDKNGYCHSSSNKYAKMVLFGLKTYFKKIFLGYFYPPTLPMQNNRVKMVPKYVFTGGL